MRRVRNFFEKKGHNPIMFFLKSISEDHEINELIKREIDARNWFVLCDSENAKKSKWVQSEVEYIKSLSGKKYFHLNVEEPWEKQQNQISQISREVSVFLSSSSKDMELVRSLYEELIKMDFGVIFSNENIKPGMNVVESIKSGIEKIANENGYFLLLASSESIKSLFVQQELNTYINEFQGNRIIPVLLNDLDMNEFNATFPQVDLRQICRLSIETFEKDVAHIIQRLRDN